MLNQRFPMDEATRQYFTLLYGVLDLDSRELRTVCAGHPRPVRLGRRRDPEVIEAAGVPIGWLPGFEYEESRVSLAPGDRIYFYSDGVIEARNPRSEFYTAERLVSTLAESHDMRLEESLGALMASLAGWREGGRPDDDVSLIALEIGAR